MLQSKSKILNRSLLSLLLFSPLFLLSGCALQHASVLHTDGPIAATERDLLFVTVGLMLIVVVPVWMMTAYFARHYRAKNTRARYMPEWASSPRVEAVMWLVPIAVVAVLSAVLFIYAKRLDPYRPIASNKPPLHVEVISLDWKWIFIYPKQRIATVNELVIPTGRPVSMKLTSDTVMDSLYIPGLAGQIYTMAGMQTRLHMLADKPSSFIGRNTNFSGRDFANQRFAVHAVTTARFSAWITHVKHSPQTLNAATYARLEQPGTSRAVTYAAVEPNLFYKVIAKYSPAVAMHVSTSITKPVKKQSGKKAASPPKQPFIGA